MRFDTFNGPPSPSSRLTVRIILSASTQALNKLANLPKAGHHGEFFTYSTSSFLPLFLFKGATNRDNLVHPTRAIQFLVGTRGKNETLAIGGPWSPSLDGPNPESDPSVLIKTAIRVCRALTGIDLSNCTQWHRFLEINYRRQESSSKPARSETTVIFLPDIWSVMPTTDEHLEAKTLYEKALDAKINPPQPKPEPEEEPHPEQKSAQKPDSGMINISFIYESFPFNIIIRYFLFI